MRSLISIIYIIFNCCVSLLIFSGCHNIGNKQDSNEPQNTTLNEIICPKGLSFKECSNPPAMHGRIMIHNMTERSFEVKVEHHPNQYETKQIAPRDGWTFVGVIQGKTLIISKPSTGGDIFESTCTVIGNTQHMMNITDSGFTMGQLMMEHSIHLRKEHIKQEKEEDENIEIIQLPKRKLMNEN